MFRTFYSGDFIFIISNKFEMHQRGDVIVFLDQGTNIEQNRLVHRIVKICKKSFITRGDNNPKNDDEPVTEETSSEK